MTVDQVLSYYGGQTAAARALGITQPAVAHWVAAGRVPADTQYRIEVLTGGKLRADRPEQKT